MEDIKILEIDDTSYECKSLIEFSSLINILFKLSEKQKNIENKLDLINSRVDEKENRLNNLEIQVMGESKSEDHKVVKSLGYITKITNQKNSPKAEKFDNSSNEIQIQIPNIKTDLKSEAKSEFKSDAKSDLKSELKNELKVDTKSELKSDIKSEFKSEEKEEITDEFSGNMNPDMIKKLFKRVKDNEKKILELTKKAYEHNLFENKINNNNELINSNINKIENLEKTSSEIERKFVDFKTDYEDIKVKVQDFNIYDLFKGDAANGGNMDLSKSMIMTLENKVFKKFSYYDERYKSYDKDIFKIKEETKNNSSIVDGMKHMTEKNNQQIKDLSKNYEEFTMQMKEKIEFFDNELNNLKKDGMINSENKLLNDIIEKKIKDNEKNLVGIIQNEINSKEINYQKKENEKILKEEQENLKNNIKRFNDIEAMIRKSIEDIDAKNIRERLENLESDVMKKYTKIEGIELKNKIIVLEEEIKDQSLKIETLQQLWDKMRSDIVQLVKKIEYLNSEYSKMNFKKMTSNVDKSELSLDLIKYLEKTEFNDNKKEVNNKFEKVRLAIENLGQNLENILNTLSHTVNEKELVNYQGVVKNTLDELKLSLNKKFADKIDTNKTLKYLETQIKTVMEMSNKKFDGADNWLLAKKPLNNYLCASCENVIRGELDKKTDYIPWNKYPARDDKTYRMGHGFSRMLQMVNDDIMRSTNTDNINSNLFLNTNINNNNNFNLSNTINKETQKDDDNNSPSNNISNNVANVKLPKVKNKNLNVNTTYSLNSFDINLHKEKNKDENNQRMATSPYDDHSLSSSNINRPQIMKIYKLNKNSTLQQSNNMNSEIQQFGIQTLSTSQKKINLTESNNKK